MKLKNLITFISFAAFTSFVSSCKDSYTPITLVSTDGNITVSNNDTISLIKFTEGEEYNINGGNGKYSIEVQGKSNDNSCIEDEYSSSKNLLTIKPKTEGESYLYISDTEKNSTRILVQVKNLNKLFTVKEVRAIADGQELTLGDKATIEEKIYNSSTVKEGGKFEFNYVTKNFDSGNLIIYPTNEYSESVNTFFYENEPFYNTEGIKITRFSIYYSLNQSQPDLVLDLSDRTEENTTFSILSQDVTSIYKSTYTNLEKATLEYILETTSTEELKNNAK